MHRPTPALDERLGSCFDPSYKPGGKPQKQPLCEPTEATAGPQRLLQQLSQLVFIALP